MLLQSLLGFIQEAVTAKLEGMDGISVELYKAYLKKAVKDEYGNITECKILEVFQRLFIVVLKY